MSVYGTIAAAVTLVVTEGDYYAAVMAYQAGPAVGGVLDIDHPNTNETPDGESA